jgi:hypothetical protein
LRAVHARACGFVTHETLCRVIGQKADGAPFEGVRRQK